MIKKIELENFTIFKKIEIDFCDGINVFIGANGTGKTHILKLIYTILSALHKGDRVSYKIVNVFLPKEKRIGRLVKRANVSKRAKVKIFKTDDNLQLKLSFSNHTKETLKWTNGWKNLDIKPSIFIPVKEMLANAPGFRALYANREIHFEEIYADIIDKAYLPRCKGTVPKKRAKLLKMIQGVMSGKVIEKNEQFYLKNKQGELEFTLLAEGVRKLALLWLLIQNGSLEAGAKLFWDEPETNLNPAMIDVVAQILIELEKNGVQIFLATHNYVLLKKLDLLKGKKTKLKFFSLHNDLEKDNIKIESGNSYNDIIPNKISDAYMDIYDAEIANALEM